MDEKNPVAEALLVTDGKITAVGSLSDIQSKIPQNTETVDLKDSVLLPGFIDSHSHPLLSGTATQTPVYWVAPYMGYPTWDDVANLFKKVDSETQSGEVVLFNGLDRLLQNANELTAAQLDQFFPQRPAVVLDNSGHETYFNSKAMEALGWKDSLPPDDPVGGRFGRNEDGTSNGRGYEIAAMNLILLPLLGKLVKKPLVSASKWYKLMAENGITATSDMTYASNMLKGYEALASLKNCPLRISLYHESIEKDCGEKFVSNAPDTLLRKQGIKLWADGSPWVGTIASSYPYLDNETVRHAGIPIGPGGEKMMNYSRSELDITLDKYAPLGWQMSFHVNGDVGLDIVLDAYEAALTKHNLLNTDHRWRVEHCGGARAEQFSRAADLGVSVSLGPFQFIYWGDLLEGTLFAPEIGSQWMRFADAVKSGAKVSFHNDGSVSPPIPLLNIQAAVTRKTPSGRLHGPEQVISLDDALKAETINAAYTLKRDHEIGSLETGKLADFVELSKNPYDVNPDDITKEIKVLSTWRDGEKIDLDAFLKEAEDIGMPQK